VSPSRHPLFGEATTTSARIVAQFRDWKKGLLWFGGAWLLAGLYGLVLPVTSFWLLALGLLLLVIGVFAIADVSSGAIETLTRPPSAPSNLDATQPAKALPRTIDQNIPEAHLERLQEPNVTTVTAVTCDIRPELNTLVQRGLTLKGTLDTAISTLANDKERKVAIQAERERIGKVLRVLEQMSRRLEMVALNAAIEAARAKEYGLGFAIVANEVRTIAEKLRENVASALKSVELAVSSGDADERIVTALRASTESVSELLRQMDASISKLNENDVSVAKTDSPHVYPNPKEPLRVAKSALISTPKPASRKPTGPQVPSPVGLSRAVVRNPAGGVTVSLGPSVLPKPFAFDVAKTRVPSSSVSASKTKVCATAPVETNEKAEKTEAPVTRLEGGRDAEDAKFERF
jgi:hypothetical protein